MNYLVRLGAPESATNPPASLHDDILSRLRDLIVEGELPPGDRIPERELCARLAISRTPLREALKVLAAEGLIELVPGRGARVREFTEAEIRNLFEVVAGLDFVAGRLACARISEDGIAAIERLHLDMYACYLRRELAEYFRFNQMIHQAIIDAAGNPVLSANYAGANAVIRRLRYTANLKPDRMSDAMREHEAIMDALRRRAGEELGLLMYQHMTLKCEAVCDCLRAPSAPESTTGATRPPATGTSL